MNPTQTPDQAPALAPLDVDALMARIKSAAAAAEQAQVSNPVSNLGPNAAPDATLPVGAAPAALELPLLASALKPSRVTNSAQHQRLSLGDLLSPIDHADFLARAYHSILGREPDPAGATGYSAYLSQGGSRLRVLYTLRQSPEGKARGQALDAAPWHWLYRVTPVKRLVGPWLHRAERRYLRRNPEYVAREATRVLAQALDQQHQALAQWTRDLSAGVQQRDQALQAAQAQASHELGQQQQALGALQHQGEYWGGAIEELRRNGEQRGGIVEQLQQAQARLDTQQEHLRGDNRNLADRANAVETSVAQLRGGAEWLQRQIDDLKASLEQIEASATDAQSAIGTEVERRERLSKDLDFIRSDLIYHRGQAQELLQALRAAQKTGANAAAPSDQEPPSGPATATQPASQAASSQPALPAQTSVSGPKLPSDDRLDAYYVAFEEEFRGSQEQIRATQEGYIADLVAAAVVTPEAPLLDLGCGRGEWLALLGEHGLSAQGIDTNSVMVARCHQQGLHARCEDALAALQALPDAALGAVSAFHLIEHLPFSLLHDLLAHAHRALRPGGLLILETPNPENVLVGSHTFYHDPTHLNPMTPTATRFLVRYLGFTDPEIRRLHPYPDSAKVPGNDPLTERVNGHLCWPQDFAIIASKPKSAS